ncbi:MAG: glycosyltransferase [Micrococcales bacterium]|nr:glycosyltransferase [Micrococcales bacterium]
MKVLRSAVAMAAAGAAAATALSLVNLRHLRRPGQAPLPGRISVLVPARDEAGRIGPTLRSLQALEGVHEILVLDDDSSDATADVVAAAGLDVIHGDGGPPRGWLGKPWACQRLAQASHGDILVFLDADVQLRPDAARAAAGLLADVDLVCPYPHQQVNSPLQVLVQPLLQWSWLSFLPLRLAERSSHPLLSAGNGQFLVVRRDAYFAAGGHAAVRDQVLEDLALVRRFKATGHTVAMADGTDLADCRMYADDRELIEGYTKSLHDAFGPATVVLLAALYVAPPVVALLTRDRLTRWLGLAGYGAAVMGRVAVARRMRQPVWACVLHPLSILALIGIRERSVQAHRRGTITWRGRSISAG